MNPFLSIVIPCYNSAGYLPRCADPLISQLTERCELIFVDDGSTDETRSLCRAYEKDGARLISIKRQGVAAARNAGIANARGEYLWFVDSDDVVAPDAVSVILNALDKSLPDALRFSYRMENAGKISTPIAIYPPGIYEGDRLFSAQRYAVGHIPTGGFFFWNHVYKTALYREYPILPIPQYHAEDESFAYCAYPRLNKLLVIENVLYHYRTRAGSTSRVGQPHAQQILNCWCYVRNEYRQQGVWERYRDVLAWGTMNVRFLGYTLSAPMGFASEYKLNPSPEDARRVVQSILGSTDFKELLADAKKLPVPEKYHMLYAVMEQENEDVLHKLVNVFL